MAAILVLITTPDLRTAKRIAKSLVTQKLAACVSLKDGFVSTYRWQGKIESALEVMLFIKTSKKAFAKVKRFVQKVHPYDLPEILALPVANGSPEYLKWLNDSLK